MWKAERPSETDCQGCIGLGVDLPDLPHPITIKFPNYDHSQRETWEQLIVERSGHTFSESRLLH